MWSTDFVADNLFDGRKLRMLTVVNCFTRESLAIHVGQSLKGEDVVRVVDAITRQRGAPQTIKTDNGSEFISKAMDRWAYEHKVEIDFSRPGKPTDNAMIESFNGRPRQECLTEHWFMSLEDAKSKIEAWRMHYNESRPHSALDWRTPCEFALLHGLKPMQQGKPKAEMILSKFLTYDWYANWGRVRNRILGRILGTVAGGRSRGLSALRHERIFFRAP